jgi:hypothetical protein
MVTMMLVSILVINLGYRFEGSLTRLGRFDFVSMSLAGAGASPDLPPDRRGGNRFAGGPLAELPVPLPVNYVRGVDRTKRDYEVGAYSFLCGQLKHGGWWHYYLSCLLVKTPLGSLLIFVAAIALLANGVSRPWWDELVLALPALALFALVSSQTGFNHHVRYVLPCLPYLAVSCGKVGMLWLMTGRSCCIRGARLFVGICLSWGFGSCVMIHPHYISYFNEVAGGPDGGYRYLGYSNIDWGQDLFRLKEWFIAHPEARPLHLAYFGLVDAHLEGIDYELPAPGPRPSGSGKRGLDQEFGPFPGWYAISVNYLQGLPYSARGRDGGLVQVPLGAYSYFDLFIPVAKAGYSIHIYHITLEEANRTRARFGLRPLSGEGSGGRTGVGLTGHRDEPRKEIRPDLRPEKWGGGDGDGFANGLTSGGWRVICTGPLFQALAARGSPSIGCRRPATPPTASCRGRSREAR